MAFNISPQINIFERDFTLTLEMKGDTKGAQSGVASWGPVLHPTLITSGEEGFRSKFWTPTNQNYLSYFIARDFLKYSNKLVFNRVCGPLARNSIATGGGIQCPQERNYIIQNWSQLLQGNCALEYSINGGPWVLLQHIFEGSNGGYFSNMLANIDFTYDGDENIEPLLFAGGGGGLAAWQIHGGEISAATGGAESPSFTSYPMSIKFRDGFPSNAPVVNTVFGVSEIELLTCGFYVFPGY